MRDRVPLADFKVTYDANNVVLEISVQECDESSSDAENHIHDPETNEKTEQNIVPERESYEKALKKAE